ncbi:MAG TPA: flagellin [Opitutaceae bacterium]
MSIPSLSNNLLTLTHSLGRNQQSITDALTRLSTGDRIVRPSDDVAGIGAGAKFDAQQRRLDAAQVNVQNGTSRLQATDGFLQQIGEALTRMSELSVFARDTTRSDADVTLYEREFQQLQAQLRSTIGGTTAEIGGTSDVAQPFGTFAGNELFGASGATSLAIGLHPDETVTLPDLNLRTGAMQSLLMQDGAGAFTLQLGDAAALDTLNGALAQVAGGRAELGGVQSRLTLAASQLETTHANLDSVVSRIRDTDVASDTTALSRLQLLSEAHTAMLAQGREIPAKLVSLLTA